MPFRSPKTAYNWTKRETGGPAGFQRRHRTEPSYRIASSLRATPRPIMRGWAGGALVWLVPFAVSCLFIGPDGEKTIPEATFKSVMVLVGSLTAAFAVGRCDPRTTRQGLTLAVVWLMVNYALDLAVLVPLFAMNADPNRQVTLEGWVSAVPVWFMQIGIGYIGFVGFCYVAGASAERASKAALQ
eukprot:gene3499-3957_t